VMKTLSLTHSPTGEPKGPADYCEKLMHAKRRIYHLNARSFKVVLQLRGIYAREDLLFFCLWLCNRSHIDYAIDSIRFYMSGPGGMKKGIGQVRVLSPLLVCGNARIIRGKTKDLCIFALPRFTLPPRQHLFIELLEKNGGRDLQLQTDNYTLVNARLL
jgi:hypothetical protein